MADGENTECLWSKLDQFAYMSREMTPANRQDLLTMFSYTLESRGHWMQVCHEKHNDDCIDICLSCRQR